jgi:hypothetical protein
MIEGMEFSDALFFSLERVGKYGEESAGCRNLKFVGEKTFEMTSPRGPKGSAFDPSAMTGVLMVHAGGRSRGILHDVTASSNRSSDPNVWRGTFDRAEGLLGGPLFRWHFDNHKGDIEGAAKHARISENRYVMLINGNDSPTPEEMDILAANTGILREDLEKWANFLRNRRSR